MARIVTLIAVGSLMLSASRSTAQEAPQPANATKEHQWLKQFVGQWESESEAVMAPGQPPLQCTGTMSSKMLGDLWVISELTGNMPGITVKGVQTIGYDPSKQRYVGTWVDSMMNHLWRYEGTVDESGRKLVLDAEGPDFMGDGKSAKYRDAYEFKSKDHIVVTSSMLGDDGQWFTFMTGHFRRAK